MMSTPFLLSTRPLTAREPFSAFPSSRFARATSVWSQTSGAWRRCVSCVARRRARRRARDVCGDARRAGRPPRGDASRLGNGDGRAARPRRRTWRPRASRPRRRTRAPLRNRRRSRAGASPRSARDGCVAGPGGRRTRRVRGDAASTVRTRHRWRLLLPGNVRTHPTTTTTTPKRRALVLPTRRLYLGLREAMRNRNRTMRNQPRQRPDAASTAEGRMHETNPRTARTSRGGSRLRSRVSVKGSSREKTGETNTTKKKTAMTKVSR